VLRSELLPLDKDMDLEQLIKTPGGATWQIICKTDTASNSTSSVPDEPQLGTRHAEPEESNTDGIQNQESATVENTQQNGTAGNEYPPSPVQASINGHADIECLSQCASAVEISDETCIEPSNVEEVGSTNVHDFDETVSVHESFEDIEQNHTSERLEDSSELEVSAESLSEFLRPSTREVSTSECVVEAVQERDVPDLNCAELRQVLIDMQVERNCNPPDFT
jgi:hypothetical protein